MIGLTLTLLVQQQAQGQDRVRSIPVGGSPLVPERLVNGPVPRLPDGKPDLTGPWVAASTPAMSSQLGGGTRSDGGKGTRSSSTRSASTTSSGSIVAGRRTPSNCTPPNGGRGSITGRSSTNSPSTTLERFRGQSS